MTEDDTKIFAITLREGERESCFKGVEGDSFRLIMERRKTETFDTSQY